VVFCQRYVTGAGIGTVASMMLPFSAAFIVLWTLFLMLFWALGIPLGLLASYSYP
jgi:aminobenzoyl-glutamate transport protein